MVQQDNCQTGFVPHLEAGNIHLSSPLCRLYTQEQLTHLHEILLKIICCSQIKSRQKTQDGDKNTLKMDMQKP